MKKSTWLSLATAAAIVTTSAGTFAAWDQMTAKTDSMNLTIAAPVTQTFTTTGEFAVKDRVLSTDAPVYEKDITLSIANIPQGITATDYKVETTAKIYDGSGTTTEATNATVEVSGTPTLVAGDQKITVKVTPNSITPIASDTTYNVVVSAEIVKTTN